MLVPPTEFISHACIGSSGGDVPDIPTSASVQARSVARGALCVTLSCRWKQKYLEINTRFGLWVLSGKAATISKSISKTHIILETTLETGGLVWSVCLLVYKFPCGLERHAQRVPPRRHLPGRGPYFGTSVCHLPTI